MKLVPIQTVISKIIRDFGLRNKNIPWQDIVEFTAEALQHIGAYAQFESSTTTIQISGYSGKLPKDYYQIESCDYAYKIQNDTIITSFETGELEIKYLRIPVDGMGLPLVPDNVSYHEAIKWYVGKQLAVLGSLPNKQLSIPYCNEQWQWYCAQARGEGYANELNTYAMERMARNFTRLIPLRDQYMQDFKNVGGKEILNRDGFNS